MMDYHEDSKNLAQSVRELRTAILKMFEPLLKPVCDWLAELLLPKKLMTSIRRLFYRLFGKRKINLPEGRFWQPLRYVKYYWPDMDEAQANAVLYEYTAYPFSAQETIDKLYWLYCTGIHNYDPEATIESVMQDARSWTPGADDLENQYR